MAKYKLAGKGKKGGKKTAVAALPCVIIVLGVFVLVMILFYFVLKSGS